MSSPFKCPPSVRFFFFPQPLPQDPGQSQDTPWTQEILLNNFWLIPLRKVSQGWWKINSEDGKDKMAESLWKEEQDRKIVWLQNRKSDCSSRAVPIITREKEQMKLAPRLLALICGSFNHYTGFTLFTSKAFWFRFLHPIVMTRQELNFAFFHRK